MISIDINSIAISNIDGVDCCNITGTGKSEVIKIIKTLIWAKKGSIENIKILLSSIKDE